MNTLSDNGISMPGTDRESPVWRQRILDAMRARVEAVVQQPLSIPDQAGGWVHQYVCPEHGLPLIFDLRFPTIHYCPLGEIHQGEIYDAAFRVFAHRHYAALARDAAVLFKVTGEDRYFQAAFEIISRYADLYEHFNGGEKSQPWMLAGKAFHQALTEAIWTVPLVYAFEIIRTRLHSAQIDFLIRNLLSPIAKELMNAHEKLVFQQNNLKSNYNAWLIAALGCLGFSLNDESLITRAIHGPGGFKAHLNAAILPDGFEFEGSPYYHNFVSWAYTLLAELALRHGIDLYVVQGESGQSIQRMWSALAAITWSDGSLPFLHDGSYWQSSTFDAELCEVYEIAFARTGEPRYAWLLERSYKRRATGRDAWPALMFGSQDITASQQPAIVSTCLKDIGLVLLRDSTHPDGLAALLRFGPYGGSHTHMDCLGLLLFPCSLDAGNPPYGVDIRRSWYQQSAAHNTVMVDGQSQAPSGGRLLSWTEEPNRSAVKAAADDVYPGVDFSREITLADGRVSDHTHLRAGDEHIFDWLLHTDVDLDPAGLRLSPAQGMLFPNGSGSFIHLVSQGIYEEAFQATFKSSGRKYRLMLSSPAPLEIFLARSPRRGGLDMAERHTLVARVRGHAADFMARYEEN
ncbi:MAG: heparinase II/III family protein [Anaerolineales bacterium]